MILEVEFINGRWLVNKKRLMDLNHDERNHLDDFFRDMKIAFESEERRKDWVNSKRTQAEKAIHIALK